MGFCGGWGVFYAELEPKDFGFDGDGGIGYRRNIFGAAEDVNDVDRIGDVFEAGGGIRGETHYGDSFGGAEGVEDWVGGGFGGVW
jgi:hypothetical protein